MGDEATTAREVRVDEVVDAVVARLRAEADPERAAGSKAYLKSDLEFWGVGVPAVRAVVKAVVPARAPLRHDVVVGVAEALWAEPVFEQRLAASFVLEHHVGALGVDDLPMVERLLREGRTWALVDNLAPNVAGPILAASPETAGTVLDRWNVDDDLWLRRASVLALLRPLRAGAGDWDRFCRYADALWLDREFFVRKALGWVLRDTSKKRPDLVVSWLLPRAATASGVTIREAVKHLSAEQQEAVAASRRTG